jgi:dimethylhistidine N-methyltransferase
MRARFAPPPVDAALARDVLEGLGAAQKRLPSKWFYDDEGSRLFQKIMTLPEYCPTRTEHGILKHKASQLVQWIAPDARALDLIELGSGDGEKTLSLCAALLRRDLRCTYYPIDVSQHALSELGARFHSVLPELDVRPVRGDYFDDWPATSGPRRQVALLLGGNLGNLTFDESVALLGRVRLRLAHGDVLLLGLDLKKDPAMILAAYDDAQGVTAAFNLNLLRRLNRELDMDFDLSQFSHFPTYSPLDGAARSFLVSRRRQVVRSGVLGRTFPFQKGETIYTEQSQKYSFEMIVQLAAASGFAVASHVTDDLGWYTVAVLQAIRQEQ